MMRLFKSAIIESITNRPGYAYLSSSLLQSACIWALRCLTIQRQLLDEQNELMKNKIFHLMDKGLLYINCVVSSVD